MRTIAKLLLPLVLTGCSAIVIGSGQHRDILNSKSNRDKVRAKLGSPIESLMTGSQQYDYYRVTGRVVPDDTEFGGYVQGIGLSFGILEVFALPIAVVMVPLDWHRDHQLKINYNSKGAYVNHSTDSWPFKNSNFWGQVNSASNNTTQQNGANNAMEGNR